MPGVATIETCTGTTNFDTVLYIREATCSTGTELACNDDACSAPLTGNASQITPTVTSGVTYYIFVDGFSGEQFALPEAVGLLRRHAETGEPRFAVIGAVDPLNLGGIIVPGAKTPAVNGWRILLHDGVPLARSQGEDIELLDQRSGIPVEEVRRRLLTVRRLRNDGSVR